jgi:hypothetical protein
MSTSITRYIDEHRGAPNLDITEYGVQRKWSMGGKSAGRWLSEWSESSKSGQMLGRTVVRVFGNLDGMNHV